jgi:hypothetical protein
VVRYSRPTLATSTDFAASQNNPLGPATTTVHLVMASMLRLLMVIGLLAGGAVVLAPMLSTLNAINAQHGR